ncbi:hypothetical protein ACET3Z_017339 [Daucus carota]
MENFYAKEDDQVLLPPGFRFHPTDEELISHYLSKKVVDSNFSATAIAQVDMNKIEPWDLPRIAKMGEKEWYFFCVRDKKYPTGLRTNRATAAGYWKATGKDKEIYRGKSLVGMKKTLVFYGGRAPKGEKSNWVIHEYRLEGKYSLQNLPKTARNEWVICRVFKKSAGGKKVHISGLMRMNSVEKNEMNPISLPPLVDNSVTDSLHVPCFSNTFDIHKSNMMTYLNNPLYPLNNSNPSDLFPRLCPPNPSQSLEIQENLQCPGTLPGQDQGMLRGLFEDYGTSVRQNLKTENEMISLSHETGLSRDMKNEISSVVSNLDVGRRPFDAPSTSVGPLDLDCLWNY